MNEGHFRAFFHIVAFLKNADLLAADKLDASADADMDRDIDGDVTDADAVDERGDEDDVFDAITVQGDEVDRRASTPWVRNKKREVKAAHAAAVKRILDELNDKSIDKEHLVSSEASKRLIAA